MLRYIKVTIKVFGQMFQMNYKRRRTHKDSHKIKRIHISCEEKLVDV